MKNFRETIFCASCRVFTVVGRINRRAWLFLILFVAASAVVCGGVMAGDNIKEIEESLSSVAEKSFPAVVVITTKRKMSVPQNPWDMLMDSPYMEKFRRRFPRGEQEGPVLQGGGSGFIVSDDGYIVTNNHVVQGNDEIMVRMNDKGEFAAKIVGTDPKTDIAVLKIEAGKKLPVLEFADSDRVKIGNFCIAIGAPFMLDYTMTFGIVSQKGRQVGLNFYENYIQTDAAINMGNSGGPLLNLDGKVIGVNDFIVSGNSMSPGNIGLGFAIPSNMVKGIYEQLKKHGVVVRPWVGIGMDELPPARKAELKIDSGVLVREIYEGHPADKAGMEPGDVILEVSGKKVDSPRDVQAVVLEHNPGDTVEFKIFRGGKTETKKVVAGKQAADLAAMIRGEQSPGEGSSEFGLEFVEKNGKVLVSEVLEGGAAAMAGIEPGMAVLSINGMKVRGAGDVEKALGESKGELSLVVSDAVSKRMITIKKVK